MASTPQAVAHDNPELRTFQDNWQDREFVALARCWNRCDRQSRLDFLEMAQDSNGDLIEP